MTEFIEMKFSENFFDLNIVLVMRRVGLKFQSLWS